MDARSHAVAAMRWAKVLLFLMRTAPAVALSCGECGVIQEAIQRSMAANISALAEKSLAGTQQTATIMVGQVIWRVCSSDTWREHRYRDSLDTACRAAIDEHLDTWTKHWEGKTTDEYTDPLLALRMKRAACTAVDACGFDELPSDYSPLRPDECAVCRALASDIFGMVRFSREAPKSAKTSDSFYRLVTLMGHACRDMPMRHAIRPEQRESVVLLCEDLWDEHEGAFSKLALKRDESFAMALCSEHLELCDSDSPASDLYAYADPTAAARGKEEL